MAMDNTPASFRDKWERNKNLAFYETMREDSEIFRWILTRNGFTTVAELRDFLGGKRRILDAGCGNGRVTALLRKFSSPEITGIVGIDLVSARVAEENLASHGLNTNTSFFAADLLGDLSWLGKFDFIYCQEVLHHTHEPGRAFRNLCSLLAPGGHIAIYVYKRKAPVREFVDDYIQGKISGLPYDEALKVCDQITELGRELSEKRILLDIPAVDVLEIPAGKYDLQRFLYHFFMKCFWSPDLSFSDNSVVNYDWYHPQTCSRHTEEEVKGWFREAGLKIQRVHLDHYGITALGRAGTS
jgi:SAM-dependent methyltransferase